MGRFKQIFEDPSYDEDGQLEDQEEMSTEIPQDVLIDIPELDEIYSPYYGA